MITKIKSEKNGLSLKFYFALYCVVVFYSFLFVWILEHHLPGLHAGFGLLKGDNILFHNMAVDMANNIQQKGWSHWNLFSGLAGTINVGITSAIYYFFGPHPKILIPLNALLATISAFYLGKIIFNKTGRSLYAYFASLIFCLFPVTLIWVSQLHKDNYAIFSWVLIFYGIFINQSGEKKYRSGLFVGAGLILLLLTRPFYVKLASAILFLDIFINLFKQRSQAITSLMTFLFSGLLLFSFYRFASIGNTQEGFYDATKYRSLDEHRFVWHGNKKGIDALFLQMASIRTFQTNYIEVKDLPNSYIDRDVVFHQMTDFFHYFPRALRISLLEPNPVYLAKMQSLTTSAAIFEMLIYYFFLANLAIAIFLRKIDFHVLKLVAFALFCILPLTYISPVLGNLHRVRFPFFFIILMAGIISFHELRKYYFTNLKAEM